MAKVKKYRLYRPEKVQNSGAKKGPLTTLSCVIVQQREVNTKSLSENCQNLTF